MTPSASPHVPVLLDEVIAALQPRPGDLIIDGTFGAGGYTRALLDAGASVELADSSGFTPLYRAVEFGRVEAVRVLVKAGAATDPEKRPRPIDAAAGLVLDAKVEAKFVGKAKFYPGKIEAVNADGTFAILFDDGGNEASAIPENVVPVVSGWFDDGKFDEERKKAIEAILRDKPSA